MKKNFVFDTNVLLHDPRAIFQFDDNHVVIPIYVIEELDQFKKHANELGRNARQLARYIDQFRLQGSLSGAGVELPHGGNLRVLLSESNQTKAGKMFQDKHLADNKILSLAMELRDREPDYPVVFISKDTNLRIRADALGLKAEDYEPEAVSIDELYTGKRECYVPANIVDHLFDQNSLTVDDLKTHIVHPDGTAHSNGNGNGNGNGEESQLIFHPNQFILLRNISDDQHTAIARVEPDGKTILPRSRRARDVVWGVRGRNTEQNYALDLLLDERIKLVTLVGKAGTGKTLLAVAAGLQCTVEESLYQRLLVSRPVLPMGRDIGYLPGSMEDKLTPWMQPIIDNVEFLMGISGQDKKKGRSYHELIDMGMLQIEPLTYIRGRSIPQQYMIVDECLPYNTPVVTELGPRKIGALFSQWIQKGDLPRVKSFDEETGRFVWKEITRMWHRGEKPLCEVQLSNQKIRSTHNHPFKTHRGWVHAEDLVAGDLVVSSHPGGHQRLSALTKTQQQALLGSFLGKGVLTQDGDSSVQLKITQQEDRREYCAWKAALFSCDLSTSAFHVPADNERLSFTTSSIGEPRDFPLEGTHCPQWVLDELDVRGLALWFMDNAPLSKGGGDGIRFGVSGFGADSVCRMVEKLKTLEINATLEWGGEEPVIALSYAGYRRVGQLIAPWCHPTMADRLHPEDRHAVGSRSWPMDSREWGYVVVKGVRPVDGVHHVFDIEVDGSHNFMIPSMSSDGVGGQGAIVVHNSQNLTPHEVKTIVSRVGEGTKIILTGDPYQIDHPYVDASDNGLVHAVNRFVEQGIAGHVTLEKGERSELAELAANLL